MKNLSVRVTCSPTKGVDETLDMSERLADRGFRVVPHIAARMVRDRQHLREIISRINKTPIVSVFVPGGDADQPLGQYGKALDLLRDLAADVGVDGDACSSRCRLVETMISGIGVGSDRPM